MARRKVAPKGTAERITDSIGIVRGHSVLLDVDLASLYGVETRVLLQAVKRNMERFPEDFLLQLTADEWESLRSQIVISNVGRGGRRYTPYAFTEQGVAMLSSVLNSSRAIAVHIEIMRAFVRMRGGPASDSEVVRELTKVKRQVEAHDTVLVRVMDSMSERKSEHDTRSVPGSPEDEER
jgi:hypothetical protein